ncbi:hypothetical protein LJC33_05055 [Eubacteriales bacterium OttesenSCG-928-N13]|nr:hypothetical protein [Eubacteriales bacterium OttesenSCG-928-N13]
MGVNVSFRWNQPPVAIAAEIITPAVKLYAASEWHKIYTPFVPMGDTGQLSSAVNYLVDGKMGTIHHLMVYSHSQYNGKGFNFRRDKHPLASAAWDQACIAAGGRERLLQTIQAYIGR